MAYGNHQTKLFLCRVPWDNNYSDTRTFDTPAEQINYFKGSDRKPLYFPNDTTFRFLDGDGTNARKRDIKVPLAPEEAQSYNYCVYSNDNEQTWHYMFISSADYINYETSLLHLEEDLLQNYMFNYELLPSNVVKEIPTTDNYSASLLNQSNLSTGFERTIDSRLLTTNTIYYPYVYVSSIFGMYASDSTPRRMDQMEFDVGAVKYHGCIIIFRSLTQYLQWLSYSETIQSRKRKSVNFIGDLAEALTGTISDTVNPNGWTASEEILQAGMISKTFVGSKIDDLPGDFDALWICDVHSEQIKLPITSVGYIQAKRYKFDDFGETQFTYQRPTHLIHSDGVTEYRPRNKALLRSPYTYMSVEVMGQRHKFNIDYFGTTVPKFVYKYGWDNGFKCYISPFMYGSTTEFNYTQCIEIPISCTVPTTFNSYWDWLRQTTALRNADEYNHNWSMMSQALQTTSSTLMNMGNSASQMDMGGVLQSAVQGEVQLASQVMNGTSFERSMNASYKQALDTQKSYQKGTLGGASIEIQNNFVPRLCLYETIPGELAEEVDNLYSVSGYDVCKYKVPEINAHQHWDYIQTVNCKIGPNSNPFMNNDAKNKIQNIYNQGVRLWHDTDPGDYGDYSNPID